MKSKTVQCLTPQDLKAAIDFIIAADAPTFMSVVEMLACRSHFVIIWA